MTAVSEWFTVNFARTRMKRKYVHAENNEIE